MSLAAEKVGTNVSIAEVGTNVSRHKCLLGVSVSSPSLLSPSPSSSNPGVFGAAAAAVSTGSVVRKEAAAEEEEKESFFADLQFANFVIRDLCEISSLHLVPSLLADRKKGKNMRIVLTVRMTTTPPFPYLAK